MEVIYDMGNEEGKYWCGTMALWTWSTILMAQIAVFVERHFIEFQKTYACVTIGFCISMFLTMIIATIFVTRMTIIILFFMVAFLIMSIVTVWYTGKKAKECYYD
jgi:hypothetical protein